MENKKPENPSAFSNESNDVDYKGMTLRDYFAAKAMQGICADGHTFWDNRSIQGEPTNIATLSFAISEAMLKQREL